MVPPIHSYCFNYNLNIQGLVPSPGVPPGLPDLCDQLPPRHPLVGGPSNSLSEATLSPLQNLRPLLLSVQKMALLLPSYQGRNPWYHPILLHLSFPTFN